LDWVGRITLHQVKAELNLRLGHYPEAASEATRQLTESPTGYGSRYASSEARKASAYFIRAMAEAHQGHHQQALDDFNQAYTNLEATMKPDRGYHWFESYHAQALLRESTELFEEKGMKPVIISPMN
jgi:tetratricopeptide (TPR) repeat protein